MSDFQLNCPSREIGRTEIGDRDRRVQARRVRCRPMAQSARTGGPPATQADWAAQAAATVEHVVGGVRDKTTVPLTTVARAIVFGTLAGIVGVAALVLLAVGGVRLLDAYLPGPVFWAHLLVGMVFTVVGLWFLRRATATNKG